MFDFKGLTKFFDKPKRVWAFFLMLGMIAAFTQGKKVNTVYVVGDEVVTVTDTLYQTKWRVKKEVEVRTDTLVVSYTDTLTQTVHDSIFVTNVAEIDTILGDDGELNVKYYYTPSMFDITWNPYPIEVRCKQILGGQVSLVDPRDNFIKFGIGLGAGQTWDNKFNYSGLITGRIGSYGSYLQASRYDGYTLGVFYEFK
jgi:hypothetical protein